MRFIFTLLFLICTGCGQHSVQNYGYTKETQAQEGDKPTTSADFIKLAIEQNDRPEFEKLLASGIDVNMVLSNGRTPLIHSTYNDNAIFVNLLVQKGADATRVDKEGRTAMDVALDLKRQRIVLILDPLQQAEMQVRLLKAITDDGDDVDSEVNELLEAGTNPNFVDTVTGETPLTAAIQVLSLSLSRLINWEDSQFGITATNVNLANANGRMPLSLAREIKNPAKAKKIIEALIKKNALESVSTEEKP